MKQALKQIEEINRLQEAIQKTNSPKLRNDYSKAVRHKKAELREYCKYKNIDMKGII